MKKTALIVMVVGSLVSGVTGYVIEYMYKENERKKDFKQDAKQIIL